MTPESIMDIFRAASYLALLVSTVIIIPGLVIGLLVAVFQAATQINEMSLNFLPKLIVTFVALSLTAPWLLNLLINYTQQLIHDIPQMIG